MGRNRKSIYISDEEIDTITYRIYNNIFTSDYYNLSQVDKPAVENFLVEGEEGVYITENYVYTNYARMIHVGTKVPQQVVFSNVSAIFYAGGISVTSKKYFSVYGWHHDIQQILKRYIENNWRYKIHKHADKTLLYEQQYTN